MAAVKSSPFAQFQDTQKLMARILDRARALAPVDENPAGGWTPPVDVFEDAEAVVMIMDLPGVGEENLELEFEADTLIVRGARPAQEASAGRDYQRMERPRGSFCRTFALPETVDRARVQALFQRGELTLLLPKIKAAGTRAAPDEKT
ncbi:Hsp20/alpha crystallin family protein [Geoalkalibacter sp.]|jgi:HSP20 family protein|uniref:Hsp20/alpha crystallin family protein n=1 Tax=Geoalkalibacter sp. TaxID=3041440 RepID=UPI00272E3473|nr:Hsp20/alpha crystallin family protein [Geoalkalibacter sp.]